MSETEVTVEQKKRSGSQVQVHEVVGHRVGLMAYRMKRATPAELRYLRKREPETGTSEIGIYCLDLAKADPYKDEGSEHRDFIDDMGSLLPAPETTAYFAAERKWLTAIRGLALASDKVSRRNLGRALSEAKVSESSFNNWLNKSVQAPDDFILDTCLRMDRAGVSFDAGTLVYLYLFPKDIRAGHVRMSIARGYYASARH